MLCEAGSPPALSTASTSSLADVSVATGAASTVSDCGRSSSAFASSAASELLWVSSNTFFDERFCVTALVDRPCFVDVPADVAFSSFVLEARVLPAESAAVSRETDVVRLLFPVVLDDVERVLEARFRWDGARSAAVRS